MIMKKILLLPIFMALTLIGCSVDPIEEDFNRSALQEFDFEAGDITPKQLETSEMVI
jgi:hypothetical protein